MLSAGGTFGLTWWRGGQRRGGGGAGERSPGPCSRGQGHLKGEVHEFKIYSNFLEKQDILVREREDQKAKYLCFVCTAPLCNEAVPKRAVLFF